jgi:hypothetical protein
MSDRVSHVTPADPTRATLPKCPAKLVLASEALKEDLAPLQPGRSSARWVLLATATALILLGIAIRIGLGPQTGSPDPASISFAVGGALACLALLPFPYALRAGASVFLGVLLILLGARSMGPLAGMAFEGGPWRELGRVAVMSCLPAALLFRAHYRAYRRARIVLAGALLLSAPFVVTEASLVLDGSASWLARGCAVLDVVAVLCGLFGFMGQDTTAAGSVSAALLLVVLATSLGLRDLTPLGAARVGLAVYATTAVAMLCAATVTAMGLYQLLAAGLAPDARARIGKRDSPRAESLAA